MAKLTDAGPPAKRPRPRDTTPRRRILAITSQLPWPLDRGGHLRSFHLLRALARQFDVRLVAPLTSHDSFDSAHAFSHLALSTIPLVKRTFASEALKMLWAATTEQPYVCYQRHNHHQVRSALSHAVEEFQPDLLYLDHLDSFLYAKQAGQLPFVIDFHNIYSVLVSRTASEEQSIGRRLFLKREAKLLRWVEQRAGRAAALALAVSEPDRAYFESLGARTHLVPNGVDFDRYRSLPTGRAEAGNVVLYIGTMDWPPNVKAALFLANEVLPQVARVIPDVILHIVGRNPPPEVLALRVDPRVNVLPNVADVIPQLEAARILAVPLDAGGGTRLKIVEAFAAGLPVISTATGCEGLQVTHGEHLIIAERVVFADALTEALRNGARSTELATHARTLARAVYDWPIIGADACEAIEATVFSG